MSSFGWGLCWPLWRRHRWGFLADVGWLAFLAAAARALPDAWRGPQAADCLGFLSAAVFIHLMAVFTYGFEIDLTSRQSAFPARMFTLPLATRTLVAWPMALGGLAAAGAWLAINLGVLRPCGRAAPLGYPAALVAAALMTIQAVAWTPFAFGWARIVVLAPLAGSLFAAFPVARVMGASEEMILGGYLACLPALGLAAMSGVSLARRGDSYPWLWLQALVQMISRLAPHRRKPFVSAAQAQFWFERRKHGAVLPFFTGLILIEIGAALAIAAINERDRVIVSRILPIALAFPALLAGLIGPSLGKHDFAAKQFALPPYLAARPMTDAGFVAAKFKMAAWSALATWGLALLLPGIWLLLPGNYARFARAFAELTQEGEAWKAVLAAGALFLAAPAMIWKQMAQGMFIGLAGRNWFTTAHGFATTIVLLLLALPAGLAFFWMPEYRALARQTLPWLVGAALAAKALAAAWIVQAIVRRKLLTSACLRNCLIGWCLIVVALAGAMLGIAPAGVLSLPAALAGAALLVPFNRLAAAPLTLNWNRHR